MNNRLIPVMLCTLFLLCSISFNVVGQGPSIAGDSTAVARTVIEFVDAFSNLRWPQFTAFFSDDATAFFPPSAHFSGRADNKEEIEKVFSRVFEHAKKQKQSPPYLIIEPRDVKIQRAGSEVAIVTFHLNDPALFGRRTLVFRKEPSGWKIIHLHASGVAYEP